MHLRILLPSAVFADETAVTRIAFGTQAGHFGLLPQRLDCVAALLPGILRYETAVSGERLVAIDTGTLVKTGADVLVCVRRAFGGASLQSLRDRVEQEFLKIDANERRRRLVVARMEQGLLQRLAGLADA